MPGEPTSRLDQTLLVVDLPRLIWRRLCGEPTVLPPMTRDEDPADVFVDAVVAADGRYEASDVAESLRHASSHALRRFGLHKDSPVGPLGELIYLCGRIDAVQAIECLTALLQREDSRVNNEVQPGETLRQRALRSLVGLLAAERRSERQVDRSMQVTLLKRLQDVSGCEVLAATGLIGLGHKVSRDLPRDQVDINLSVAGFPNR
jgi:hypothetical protein